jgi:hypothetical protein
VLASRWLVDVPAPSDEIGRRRLLIRRVLYSAA